MKTTWKPILLVSALLLAALGGCGGGGGGGAAPPPPPPPPPPTGGIGRNGIAVGPVTTFGSIVVNGVRYGTATATFTKDGSSVAESDLKVGQLVLVEGIIDDNLTTGTANSVTFDDNVTGPVESIDVPLGQLVVMGQLVLVNADTSFDNNISPASLEGLTPGDLVEVSGFFSASGDTAATRIERAPPGTQLEVHGIVSSLDAANFLFSINGLVVDFTNATLMDFPGGQVSDGDFVQAKGSGPVVNNELAATLVELETVGVNGAEGDHVEVEGLITRFVSDTDFDVSGIPVTTDGGTVYTGGVATDLGLNTKVEVEGSLDANGVLLADTVDIRRAKVIRSIAIVDSVDAANNSLVMLGITFSTDELTRFEDKSSANLSPLTINDLNMGDYLEIRGAEFPAGSGQILAGILERDDVDTRTILQGFVSNVAGTTLTILGVTIETNGAVFRDIDDSIITQTAFFNLVGVNTLVKARGTETSGTMITATEVDLELEL